MANFDKALELNYAPEITGYGDTGLIDIEFKPQKTTGEKIKGVGKSIFESIIEAPKGVAMAGFRLTPAYREAVRSEETMLATEKRLRASLDKMPVSDPLRIQYENFDKEEVPTISVVMPPRNARQVAGDIAETVLLAAPIPIIRGLKGLPWLAKAARGILIGGAFGGATAMRQDEWDWNNAVTSVGLGAVIGAGAEFAIPAVGKGAGFILKRVGKKVAQAGQRLGETSIGKTMISVRSRLETHYGQEGKDIINKFLLADEEKLLRTGQVLNTLEDTGFYKLTKRESDNVVDLLEGRAKTAVTNEAKTSFDFIDKLRKGFAQEASETKLQIRLAKGQKVPFTPKENYYPRDVFQPAVLKKGAIRQEILEGSVRIGRFKDTEEAGKVLDGWIQIVELNGRKTATNTFVDNMIKTGQAKTKDEAWGKVIRYFKRSLFSKFGHLEYAREFDFPFYDTNPQRAITKWVLGSIDRLETVKTFGISGEEIATRIGTIRRKMGEDTAKEVGELVNILTKEAQHTTGFGRASLIIRTLQTPKLAFTQIINLGQNVNTLLATDLPSFAKGISSVFTKMGRSTAVKSGATIDSVIQQTIELGVGGEQRFARLFLKYSGFQLTERVNRIVASNAGIAYTQKSFKMLLKKPDSRVLKQRLTEVGINAEEAMSRGYLTELELLRAGQKVSNFTQFRYRPADFPAFYNSDFGRLAFQFKSFAYNQTLFLKNQISRDIATGDPTKMFRTLMVLGLIFPMTGEITRDIRSLITQEKRPTKFLDRYLEDIMSVGGAGILTDLYQSAKYDRLAESLIGPALGSATQAVTAITKSLGEGKITPSRARQMLSLVGPLATYPHKWLFPSKYEETQEEQSVLETLQEKKEDLDWKKGGMKLELEQ
jgi:hypothetical protein